MRVCVCGCLCVCVYVCVPHALFSGHFFQHFTPPSPPASLPSSQVCTHCKCGILKSTDQLLPRAPPNPSPPPIPSHPTHKTPLVRLHSSVQNVPTADRTCGTIGKRLTRSCQKETVSRCRVLGFLLRQRETKTGAVVGAKGETFSFPPSPVVCCASLLRLLLLIQSNGLSVSAMTVVFFTFVSILFYFFSL